MTRKLLILLLSLALGISSCMKQQPIGREDFTLSQHGVYILAEGNFRYGNASLAYYDPSSRTIRRNVFLRANGRSLGDVAQSMNIYDSRAYIVVNNSGVIYITDPSTGRLLGAIKGLTSPRYIHFLTPTKAYVTDLADEAIRIVNPQTRRIVGRIPTPSHRSTEQMVQWQDEVWVSCWSYDNKLLVLDSRTDKLTHEITVGRQPSSLVLDRNGKIWVLCSGGIEGSALVDDAPSIWRIDARTKEVEQIFRLNRADKVTELVLDGSKSYLYFVRNDIYRMSVEARELPTKIFAPSPKGQSIYYALGVDPRTGEVYAADAIDYQQSGRVYRYSSSGVGLDTIRVGIIPGAFCFR